MMLRPRPGLIGALLAVGLFSAACAARTPAQVALAPAPALSLHPRRPPFPSFNPNHHNPTRSLT